MIVNHIGIWGFILQHLFAMSPVKTLIAIAFCRYHIFVYEINLGIDRKVDNVALFGLGLWCLTPLSTIIYFSYFLLSLGINNCYDWLFCRPLLLFFCITCVYIYYHIISHKR